MADSTKIAILNLLNSYLKESPADQIKSLDGADPADVANGLNTLVDTLHLSGVKLPSDLNLDSIDKRITDNKNPDKVDHDKVADVAQEIKSAITGGDDVSTHHAQSDIPNTADRSKTIRTK